MIDDKSCSDCLWNDKCYGRDICEHYFPADPKKQLAILEDEYEQDLAERVADYEELIEEMEQ